MSDELEDALMQHTTGTAGGQDEQVSFMIWGAVVTTTRAFSNVEIKVDAVTNRVFVTISLRWWAKIKKFNKFRDAWMRLAEKRCKPYIPEGWRLLIYYKKGME
jgi:hypothetical protein